MRRYAVVRSLGGVRLRSHSEGSAPVADGGRVGRVMGRAGSPVTALTPKARRQMRWVWNALPWDELDRLAMLTLTYPADWRRCAPDGVALRGTCEPFVNGGDANGAHPVGRGRWSFSRGRSVP